VADVDALLSALTLEEKALLTAGSGMLSLAPVDRLGIPPVNVTDGPSGARGASYPGMGGPPSTCIPCGSAIGATWDPVLAEHLGALVGREALERGCRGLLAPTVNLHRSPLAGRDFECYSEDPLLSGRLAAGYVRGVQSNGVFATVKHFVANDAEFERASISSVVDERTLRELYLLPFEIAVKEGGALAIMSSYNRVNGRWVTEQRELLVDILRGEWGFEGLVMTDWFAVVDTRTSLGAGLDLEMPGPGRSLGATTLRAVQDGTVDEADLDAAVRRLLGGLDRIGALDAPVPTVEPRATPPEDRQLLRAAAAEAMVLLHNDGLLPIDPGAVRRVAVIGAPAVSPCVVGGGSAGVVLHPMISPLQALTTALGDEAEVVYRRGCEITLSPAPIGRSVLRAPDGFDVELHAGTEFAGEVVERRHLDELRMAVLASGATAAGVTAGDFSARVRGTIVPDEAGTFELSLAQAGRARVLVGGDVVLDGFADPPAPGGTDFFGLVSQDLTTKVELERDVPVEIVVEYARVEAMLAGFRVGFRTVDADRLIADAVAAASAADLAILCLGTTSEWETEGRDQPGFGLPGRQEELAAAVLAANRRTVVVLNVASAVDLSWADGAAAVLQCWFAGQELGPAVADVLTGTTEPGGRLPVTIAAHLAHYPSHDNFPGENGDLRYGEGLFMGYRGFDHRRIRPRFPFGHGLGYTTFEIGEPTLSSPTFRPGDTLHVAVPVRNTGGRRGGDVVQCYIAPTSPRLARPPKELKAFAKVRLDSGETTVIDLVLDDRSFAYWDPGQSDWAQISPRVFQMFPDPGRQERRQPGWQVDPGHYELLIGRSSEDIASRCSVEVLSGEQ
jgi:beta-glucosidase